MLLYNNGKMINEVILINFWSLSKVIPSSAMKKHVIFLFADYGINLFDGNNWSA